MEAGWQAPTPASARGPRYLAAWHAAAQRRAAPQSPAPAAPARAARSPCPTAGRQGGGRRAGWGHEGFRSTEAGCCAACCPCAWCDWLAGWLATPSVSTEAGCCGCWPCPASPRPRAGCVPALTVIHVCSGLQMSAPSLMAGRSIGMTLTSGRLQQGGARQGEREGEAQDDEAAALLEGVCGGGGTANLQHSSSPHSSTAGGLARSLVGNGVKEGACALPLHVAAEGCAGLEAQHRPQHHAMHRHQHVRRQAESKAARKFVDGGF